MDMLNLNTTRNIHIFWLQNNSKKFIKGFRCNHIYFILFFEKKYRLQSCLCSFFWITLKIGIFDLGFTVTLACWRVQLPWFSKSKFPEISVTCFFCELQIFEYVKLQPRQPTVPTISKSYRGMATPILSEIIPGEGLVVPSSKIEDGLETEVIFVSFFLLQVIKGATQTWLYNNSWFYYLRDDMKKEPNCCPTLIWRWSSRFSFEKELIYVRRKILCVETGQSYGVNHGR